MAFAPGKSGNPGGRPKEKPVREALRLALREAQETGTPKALRNIIDQLLHKAAVGDLEAIKIVFERLEGKVPTVVVGDDEEDAVTIRQIVTGVPRAGE